MSKLPLTLKHSLQPSSLKLVQTRAMTRPASPPVMPETEQPIRNISLHDDYVEHTMKKKDEIYQRALKITQNKQFDPEVNK